MWTYGHRNVQGLAWDRSGRLWESEFGQDTWDEVNLIRPGRNYGWPVVEGKGDTHGGNYTNPLVVWPTSEASPSGDAIIGSTHYVAALRGQAVWRESPIHGTTLGTPSRILTGYGRIRTVVKAPDGSSVDRDVQHRRARLTPRRRRPHRQRAGVWLARRTPPAPGTAARSARRRRRTPGRR